MSRRTKIIATIGPASLPFHLFSKIVDQGSDFIRINTAYSDGKQHNEILENIKKLSAEVSVIFDIRVVEKVKDIAHLKPKIIALSFTESPDQLDTIKKQLPDCQVIAKIESAVGVENFSLILDHADGVMVARGDLGQAITLEKVPCVQKRFCELALAQNKFLIVATEMLLSMTKNSTPTRAEVSDVANAVFAGAPAVMLSEETAIGLYPAEAVKCMRKIIESAEMCV